MFSEIKTVSFTNVLMSYTNVIPTTCATTNMLTFFQLYYIYRPKIN
jgi:hypothetical protein